MEILQIDLKGKMAHFRKYYANNTAFSFSIPPRTTIIGMLAAMLGLPKDEYYTKFASDKIRIGIALRSPVKKTFHRLNFLKITSVGKMNEETGFDSPFRGTGGRIQTPFEIVTAIHLQQDEVCYRLFIAAYKPGVQIFNELKECVMRRSIHYNLSYGIAGFSAYISDVQCFSLKEIQQKTVSDQLISFNSAVVSDKISALRFEKEDDYSFVEEELMPADFIGDHNRELSKMNRVLFTHNSLPLRVSYTGIYYILNKNQTITFLENE